VQNGEKFKINPVGSSSGVGVGERWGTNKKKGGDTTGRGMRKKKRGYVACLEMARGNIKGQEQKKEMEGGCENRKKQGNVIVSKSGTRKNTKEKKNRKMQQRKGKGSPRKIRKGQNQKNRGKRGTRNA